MALKEFCVGDRVIVHPDIASFERTEGPGIVGEMVELAGLAFTVDFVGDGLVTLKEPKCYFSWLTKWLLPYQEEVSDDVEITPTDYESVL